MQSTNEAFSRVNIDSQLAAQSWSMIDGQSVRYEYQLPDGTRADFVPCDRHGRSLTVIEAKRFSVIREGYLVPYQRINAQYFTREAL